MISVSKKETNIAGAYVLDLDNISAEIVENENNPSDTNNAAEVSDDSIELVESRQNEQEIIEINSDSESINSEEAPELTEEEITELKTPGESQEEARSRLSANDEAWINRSIAQRKRAEMIKKAELDIIERGKERIEGNPGYVVLDPKAVENYLKKNRQNSDGNKNNIEEFSDFDDDTEESDKDSVIEIATRRPREAVGGSELDKNASTSSGVERKNDDSNNNRKKKCKCGIHSDKLKLTECHQCRKVFNSHEELREHLEEPIICHEPDCPDKYLLPSPAKRLKESRSESESDEDNESCKGNHSDCLECMEFRHEILAETTETDDSFVDLDDIDNVHDGNCSDCQDCKKVRDFVEKHADPEESDEEDENLPDNFEEVIEALLERMRNLREIPQRIRLRWSHRC